ncbi:tRNA lysidine(34) synthetase TilS [bacterium]|nr:tRNA lysidine(34) synthetase TilS [bacterium]
MLIPKCLKTTHSYNMFEKGDGVVVGLSGGADSIALLLVLHSVKRYLGIELSVCHFNHKTRKESDDEALYAKRFSEDLGYPCYIEEWKAPAVSNIQKEARVARYRFFLKKAKDLEAKKIALGHNLNDSAETTLFHITRGERPLPIPPKSVMDEITIVRPLIEIGAEEIRGYLKKKNIPFILDPSNALPAYSRNKIRLEIMPELSKLNPNIAGSLTRLGKITDRDRDYFKVVAKKVADECRAGDNGFSIPKLLSYHPAIIAYIIKEEDVSFSQIEQILSLLTKPGRWKVDMGKGGWAKRKKDLLIFEKNLN